jgi:uncharacterized protein (DUF1800 family)
MSDLNWVAEKTAMALQPFTENFELHHAALLARRTMFGATKNQLEHMVSQGLEVTLEQLFNYGLEPFPDNPFKPTPDMEDSEQVQLSQRRWLFEMIHGVEPFREKLALFWSNHFVIGKDKVRRASMLEQYLGTLYANSVGSFQNLTLATSQTPAMLRYLDNDQNKKAKPNENFARELLELFTLGIGHYSEDDVSEAARAFTGWTFDKQNEPYTFVFNKKQHDTGDKTFLGETKNFTGEDIIERCSKHDATAFFVSQKIWRGFVASTVDPYGAKELATTFRQTKGDLKAVFRELFSSQLFFESAGQLIKSPIDYLVGTLRSFELSPQKPQMYETFQQALGQLGQAPLAPPHVAGWIGGRTWISDSTLLTRINLARTLVRGEKLYPHDATAKDINLAFFGSEASPVEEHLQDLNVEERVFMLLVSPDYMVS